MYYKNIIRFVVFFVLLISYSAWAISESIAISRNHNGKNLWNSYILADRRRSHKFKKEGQDLWQSQEERSPRNLRKAL